jgi:hypothetical protein
MAKLKVRQPAINRLSPENMRKFLLNQSNAKPDEGNPPDLDRTTNREDSPRRQRSRNVSRGRVSEPSDEEPSSHEQEDGNIFEELYEIDEKWDDVPDLRKSKKSPQRSSRLDSQGPASGDGEESDMPRQGRVGIRKVAPRRRSSST